MFFPGLLLLSVGLLLGHLWCKRQNSEPVRVGIVFVWIAASLMAGTFAFGSAVEYSSVWFLDVVISAVVIGVGFFIAYQITTEGRRYIHESKKK